MEHGVNLIARRQLHLVVALLLIPLELVEQVERHEHVLDNLVEGFVEVEAKAGIGSLLAFFGAFLVHVLFAGDDDPRRVGELRFLGLGQ